MTGIPVTTAVTVDKATACHAALMLIEKRLPYTLTPVANRQYRIEVNENDGQLLADFIG